jgi:glutaminyl-tRNA synthetase
MLFTAEIPDGDSEKDFTEFINPNSLTVIDPIYVEPYIKNAQAGEHYQFERLAYFVVDEDSTDEKLVFNRTVTLRDQWKKQQNKPKQGKKQKRK